MMSTNSGTVYACYPNYAQGIDMQQQQTTLSFVHPINKDAPVSQPQFHVQSLPTPMTGICLPHQPHNPMMLSTPFCPIYLPNTTALQATNYPLPMQFIQTSQMDSPSPPITDVKDPFLIKNAIKSPLSASELSSNIELIPSISKSKIIPNLELKMDPRPSSSGWDSVFSPSYQSAGSPTLTVRDDEEDMTSIRSDEEIELLTPDPERKFHINKEYLADLAMQAQSDPDVFGKISFVVFQELVDSEFLSPVLRQKARHYRRRHRNKLAAKICRDKKQTKIKDLNGEIDELKNQIYMVKSERDMLRNEVEKLSEVHMQKADKD